MIGLDRFFRLAAPRRAAAVAVLALALSAGVVAPVGAVEGVLTPTGLSASSAAGGVLLEWDAPVQDAGSVTGYRIVRRRTDVGERRLSQLVRDTGTTSTSYLDESALDGGVYIYRVRAMRGGLRSAISDKATITYQPPVDEPAPADTSDLSAPKSDLSASKSDADVPVAAGVSPVWSAVLTVDAYGGASPPSLGFWEWSRSDAGSATGGLSERNFEVGDGRFTVAALFEYVEGGLMMGLSAELPEDFVLDVDGEQFVGSESFVPGLLLRGRYWWPAAPRDWQTGDQMPVSITMGGPGDLTGRPKAPPSARFSHLPAGHNGIDAFTVRLNFDEAGLAVDAGMLRDNTLEVAGAGIAQVTEASAGKRAWDITLEPHGPKEITVALGTRRRLRTACRGMHLRRPRAAQPRTSGHCRPRRRHSRLFGSDGGFAQGAVRSRRGAALRDIGAGRVGIHRSCRCCGGIGGRRGVDYARGCRPG